MEQTISTDGAQSIPTTTQRANLKLLQDAVKAKIVYWDALRALEIALGEGKEPTDASCNDIQDTLSTLASGLDFPEDAAVHIDMKHLADLTKRVVTIDD